MSDKTKNFIKEIIPYIIIIVVVVLIRTFIVTPIMVDGPSMDPTLEDGHIMILNKMGKVDRYDIVVVKTKGETLIKRVIGLPGETIAAKDGLILINDEVIEDKTEIYTEDFETIEIKDDEYFIMGDNRTLSKDSRMIGSVHKDDIKGTTSFVIWPFKKFGNIK